MENAVFNYPKGKGIMLEIINIAIIVVLSLMVIYMAIFSIAAYLTKKSSIELMDESGQFADIAILVPSFKEDEIILSTAQKLVALNYPTDHFHIYIIADSLRSETLNKLQELPISIIPVKFKKSTKSLSINAALAKIEKHFDVGIICDADNILASNFLHRINHAFNNGQKAMQGNRVSKNMNTPFAILDTASELINNHIFRKGHNAIGLSSSVIGSGIALQFDLLKEIMHKIEAVGGFDKVLQLEIVKRKINIKYLENALIFDEKVPNASAFSHQRRRWLSSQSIYLKKYFLEGLKQLFKGNFNYFNLAIMHNFILPRVILLGIIPLCLLVSILLKGSVNLYPLVWMSMFVLFFITLLIALPKIYIKRQFLPALGSLPLAFLLMLKAFFHIKTANKSFIHTTHYQKEITNPIFNAEHT